MKIKVETIIIAGHKLKLIYQDEKKCWIAIKYGNDCEISHGMTKSIAITEMLKKLKNVH